MDSTEFAEYLDERDPTEPYYETLILDFGTDRPAWWACNHCGREIDPSAGGCPEHAPRDIPGLYRVDCEKDPSHNPMWVLDGDHTGYGVPCYRCMYTEVAADLAKLRKTDRCYHWGWRRWKLTHWLSGRAYVLGIIGGGGGYVFGGGHDGCQDALGRLRGKRSYILGASRDTWRCWLKGRHRRGEEVGFGFCGKCVPWPCCGSQTVDHMEGCTENEDAPVDRVVASIHVSVGPPLPPYGSPERAAHDAEHGPA